MVPIDDLGTTQTRYDSSLKHFLLLGLEPFLGPRPPNPKMIQANNLKLGEYLSGILFMIIHCVVMLIKKKIILLFIND